MFANDFAKNENEFSRKYEMKIFMETLLQNLTNFTKYSFFQFPSQKSFQDKPLIVAVVALRMHCIVSTTIYFILLYFIFIFSNFHLPPAARAYPSGIQHASQGIFIFFYFFYSTFFKSRIFSLSNLHMRNLRDIITEFPD